MCVVFGLLIALAVAGPLLGADSRDGRDWASGSWPRHRAPGREPPSGRDQKAR